ncbi:MAG TPA: GNAT family N-acetyltransferase [Candidatus Didemnitutus sp.]|jgi:GNAT superfamily N-acetyltransferase
MKIARARPEDAGALTGIAVAAKGHWGYPESWIHRWADVLTVTSDYIRTNPTFIAFAEERMVGFHALQLHAGEAALDHLWVIPSAMRGGIGRALFVHAEATARDAGAVVMRIEGDPHAEGFYRRMGAVVCGQRAAPMDEQARFLPLLLKAL